MYDYDLAKKIPITEDVAIQTAVSLYRNTKQIAEEIITDTSNFDIENYSTDIYNDTNIENGIINFANSVNADLIGMCTHGHTGFAHFFNGSLGEDLVNHAANPVITFKI